LRRTLNLMGAQHIHEVTALVVSFHGSLPIGLAYTLSVGGIESDKVRLRQN
jgi:hypothetical protein